jgi:hypothetical protein
MKSLTVLAALAALLLPAIAGASCIEQPEAGKWINVDRTRDLARIEVRFVCQDVVVNGKVYPPGAPWYVNAFGSEVAAQRLASGHVYAIFDQGLAKRTVYAKISESRPGQLWVYTWTDFTDPNRTDFGAHDWFKRE